MHAGRIAHHANQPAGDRVAAPSPIDANGMQPMPVPEELTIAEIRETIEAFAQATRNARDAGFDAPSPLAANGYLTNQFLSPNTNHRTGEYGGTPENRMRFVFEVFDAMATAWDAARIGIRISPVGTFNDISDPAAELAQRNAAWLHIVKPGAPHFTAWAAIRANFPGTVILNSGLTQESGFQPIDSNEAGLISYGVQYIANPNLVERFQSRLFRLLGLRRTMPITR